VTAECTPVSLVWRPSADCGRASRGREMMLQAVADKSALRAGERAPLRDEIIRADGGNAMFFDIRDS